MSAVKKILHYRGSTIGEVYERMRDEVMNELRKGFRPEFLNRIDEIIVFHALKESDLKRIVDIQLARLTTRLTDHKIRLVLSDAAKTHLVRVGYDPTYGARPVRRAIQKELETALARKIVSGMVRDGMAVSVDYDTTHDVLAFTPMADAEALG